MPFDVPPRIDEPELIDTEDPPYADFRASMTDVRNANRLLGGTSVIRRHVGRWLDLAPAGPVTFLDIATGSADIPTDLLHLCSRRGIEARITGLDASRPILRFAREFTSAAPAIQLVRGSAFALPFPDQSFDYALCSLAFHHFTPSECIAALQEMERVSRRGWIINDIRRARSAWILIRIISVLGRMNRLTRHDGPASVLRSYSIPEWIRLPADAGLHRADLPRLHRSLFYRIALVRTREIPADR